MEGAYRIERMRGRIWAIEEKENAIFQVKVASIKL